MRDLIQSLFGEYAPITDSNGDILKGLSGLDFEWLAGVALFSLMLFCIFKLLGVLFKC